MANMQNQLLDLYKKLLYLEGRNKQLVIASSKEDIRFLESQTETSSNIEECQERIDALKEELFAKKSINYSRELSCQRLQLADILYSVLTTDDSDVDALAEDKNTLEEDIVELTNLTKEIEDIEIALDESRESVLKLEKEVHTLTKQRKILWKELNSKEPQLPSTPNESVRKKLKDFEHKTKQEVEMVCVMRNIFRSLIVGSKLNWSKDAVLRDILLSVKKTAV